MEGANSGIAFIPYAIAPSQYEGGARRRLPEHDLLAMVMYAALYDVHKAVSLGLTMRPDLREWFVSRCDKYLFSFEGICEQLGFTADRLRKRVLVAIAERDAHTLYRLTDICARVTGVRVVY